MSTSNETLSAEERKRKRLEAWRKKQQEQAPPKQKLSLSLTAVLPKRKKKTRPSSSVIAPMSTSRPSGFFGDDEESDDDGEQRDTLSRQKRPLDLLEDFMTTGRNGGPASKRAKTNSGSRWDSAPKAAADDDDDGNSFPAPKKKSSTKDALDQFMEKLEAGASGTVTAADDGQEESSSLLKVNVSGSMLRPPNNKRLKLSPISGSVITAEDLEKLHTASSSGPRSKKTHSMNVEQSNDNDDDDNDIDNDSKPLYQPNDWLSDAVSDTDDEKEEQARRALIEALKNAGPVAEEDEQEEETYRPAQTQAEVKSEKSRREERLHQLEEEAAQARKMAMEAPELGRLYDDAEGGVMEEAERNLQAAQAAPDALTVLAELNKKKELTAVDHSAIDYIPFQKNLYRVPRSLASLTNDEVINRRAKLKVRVRGHGAPAPVSTFEECGLSEKILQILNRQDIVKPFPVQAQCIPCIMGTFIVFLVTCLLLLLLLLLLSSQSNFFVAFVYIIYSAAGRDCIGIARTGSGKTLAFVLPMLRHIMVQPDLELNESGPIGLVLAPARELAYQIHLVCKNFAKQLGLK